MHSIFGKAIPSLFAAGALLIALTACGGDDNSQIVTTQDPDEAFTVVTSPVAETEALQDEPQPDEPQTDEPQPAEQELALAAVKAFMGGHPRLLLHDFLLYDFNGDGIPEILAHYDIDTHWWGYVSVSALYQFVDGSIVPVWRTYEEQYSLERLNGFFATPAGDVIVHIDILHLDSNAGAYYRLNFDGDRIEFEIVADYGLGWVFDTATDTDIFSAGGHNFITGEQFFWDTWEQFDADKQAIPRIVPGGADMILTPIEPLTDLQNQLIASIRQEMTEGNEETLAAPGQGTAGDGLLGRWYHESVAGLFIEFFPDGTLIDHDRGQQTELTWVAEDGVIRTVEVDDFDFGEFYVRFSQSLDAQLGAYWTGYWIHFERSVFGSSSMGGFRYRQLDGDMGTMYGRWAVDAISIMEDRAAFEILPNGMGNRFSGGVATPLVATPFTWRIEDGRFMRTVELEGYMNYAIDGDTLTIYEIGDGWSVGFIRAGS